jgi:transglutaminase-like putative cysteine protease
MRLRIAHSSIYRYDPPTAGVIQVLRLTPRNYEGQYVDRWRIDVTPDARLTTQEDAFGNITHVFTADGPLEELVVEVDGEVETQNNNGVVRGTVERFPPSLFLRDTGLTQADDAMRDFAAEARNAASDGTALAALHALLDRIYETMAKQGLADGEPAAEPAKAPDAFARKRGTAKELTHVFIGAAHCLDIPARYVGGYMRRADGAGEANMAHAWAEAHVPDLGWIAFDPSNGYCPTDGHVRIAIGLDAYGAAPVRGSRFGGGAEKLEVAIRVDQ